MTLGGKIQYYRERLGLSREELGERLAADGQTVGLWEADQAVPAADALRRAAEIFGVSADELLDDGPPAAERYIFSYTADEMTRIDRFFLKQHVKRTVLFFISYLALLFASFRLAAPTFAAGFCLGMMTLVGIVQVKLLLTYRRTMRLNRERVPGKRYEYRMYEQYFTLSVRGGDGSTTLTLPYSRIERVYDAEAHLLLQIAGQLWIVRKSELREGSLLSERLKAAPRPQKKRWRAWLLILAVLLILFGVLLIALPHPQPAGDSYNYRADDGAGYTVMRDFSAG